MSQPKEFGPYEIDPLLQPLTNIDQLVKLFHNAERPKENFLLGVEYEMFGQINNGITPLPYESEVSIKSLFHFIAHETAQNRDPFKLVFEGENLVALSSRRAIIALEPGGQIEIAAFPHDNLLDVINIFNDVVKEIHHHAKVMGIDLFSIGIHPLARRDEMAQVKKARYSIMRNYMKEIHGLGLDMMTRSSAIQINLDFENEKDMAKKTRLAAALVPFYALLCSSTAFIEGKLCKHAVERGHIWRETDPDRTGIPAIIFDQNFGYESWINMILDVPMYFIRRGQTYKNVAGASFRQFMHHGLMGETASIRDFVDHMTTIFTEIRLKPILELRSADSLPVPFANALIALTWALFYDERAQQRALAIFEDLSYEEIKNLHNDTINFGRNAQFRGQKIFRVSEELFDIASDALGETRSLLAPLADLLTKNFTMVEWIKERFLSIDENNLPRLIHFFEPLNNPLT